VSDYNNFLAYSVVRLCVIERWFHFPHNWYNCPWSSCLLQLEAKPVCLNKLTLPVVLIVTVIIINAYVQS